MPYLAIFIIVVLAICFLFIDKYMEQSDENPPLRYSVIDDSIEIVQADGDPEYFLIMYNHDIHDEKQLGWALSKAIDLNRNIKRNKVYLLNINKESQKVSKWHLNSRYTVIDKVNILKGYPTNNHVEYMIIIKDNDKNIVFNKTLRK